MKPFSISLAAIAVALLVVVAPVTATSANALIVDDGGGGGGGGGTTTYTVNFSSADVSEGTVSAKELTPNAQPLTSGDALPSGATFEVDPSPSAGWVSTTHDGAFAELSGYAQPTFVVTGNANIVWHFGPAAAPSAAGTSATLHRNDPTTDIALPITGVDIGSYDVVSLPSHGTATITGGIAHYTPATNYVGPDSFTYTATNSVGTSAPATVSITVNAVYAAVTSSVVDTLGNAVTLNGDPFAAVTVTDATFGSIVPAGGTIAEGDNVTFIVSDYDGYAISSWAWGAGCGALIDVGAQSLELGPVSGDCSLTVAVYALSAPAAAATTATIPENSGPTAINLPITGTAATSVQQVDAPAHGTVSISGEVASYTPDAGYAGADAFTYTATNSAGTSVEATVSITVSPVYAAVASSVADTLGKTETIDGDPVAVLTATDDTAGSVIPAGGTIQVGHNVTFTLSSDDGYAVYGWSATAGCGTPISAQDQVLEFGPVSGDCTVSLTIRASAAPTAATASATVAANSGPTAIGLPITGPAATSVALGDAPAHGVVSMTGGVANYTPEAGYSGADSFTYTATNSDGTSTPATVSITVTPPAVNVSVATVVAGSTLTVAGSGFAPNETITVVLHSTPVTLATFTADGSGAFSQIVSIPAGTAAGHHTLIVSGSISGSFSSPLTVTAASAVGLAFTGGFTTNNIWLDVSLAGLLVALGTYLLYRRRRGNGVG